MDKEEIIKSESNKYFESLSWYAYKVNAMEIAFSKGMRKAYELQETQSQITEEDIENEIIKRLSFKGNTNDKWHLQASIENFSKSGSISGNMYLAIKEAAKEIKSRLQYDADKLRNYALEKDIVIWIVPESQPVLNGIITWTWEIEILPYKSMGQYFCEKHIKEPIAGQSSNNKYPYKSFDTYDIALKDAFECADKYVLEFKEYKNNLNK